ENGEGSSVSLRDNDQIQFFFESNLTGTEPSFISSPYKPEMNEIFNIDSSNKEDEELA
ncbi:35209_t:CDS:1, partial [Racocetra persica]